jgi:hypothetical protein
MQAAPGQESCQTSVRSSARPSAGHARSRTQIIPICVIGARSDEIGEPAQNGGAARRLGKRHQLRIVIAASLSVVR